MRVIYPTKRGSKPLNMGINRAKRLARSIDQRDQKIVQAQLGVGLPRQQENHKALVKQRHRYYGDVYAAQRLRSEAPVTGGAGADPADAGDADRAVPEPAPGSVDS